MKYAKRPVCSFQTFFLEMALGEHLYLKLDILIKKIHVIRVVFQDHGNVRAYIV